MPSKPRRPEAAQAVKTTPIERSGTISQISAQPVAKATTPPAAEAAPVQQLPEKTPEPAVLKSPAAPNALAAYTRRKAKELFDAGDLAGAAMCFERLLRGGADIDSLEGALDCYIGLARTQDAARVAVELVNEKADAGDLEGALATIDRISAISKDANFAQRRMELLVALGRPEAVGR
jgi:tetratricopeptide (TPR) repeat protein